MDLELYAVCESISIDQATDRLSIFNVIEVHKAEELPTTIADMCSIAVVRVTDSDCDIDWQAVVKITLPGEQAKEFTANVSIPPGSRRHRIIHRFVGVPIVKYGQMLVELLLNGRHLAEHVIEVGNDDTQEGGAGRPLAEPMDRVARSSRL